MGILDIITGGGLSAVLGAAAGIGEKIMLTKMELEAKAAEYKHLERMHELNADQQARMAEQNLLVTEVQSAGQALVASYEHDAPLGETSTWVNDVRALVRPLAIVLGFAYSWFNPENGIPMLTMMLAWYFAGRARTATPS